MIIREEMELLLQQYEELTIKLDHWQQQSAASQGKLPLQLTQLELEKEKLALRYRMYWLEHRLLDMNQDHLGTTK